MPLGLTANLGLGSWIKGGLATAATVWNAATSGPNVTISNGGLTATFASSSGDVAKASSGHSGTGDWWFDVTITATSGNAQVGLANATEGNTGGAFLGGSANSVGWNWNDGAFLGATGSGASGWVNGSVIRTRLKNGKLYFALNGTYQNSADPVAETGGIDVSGKGTLFPAVSTPGVWAFIGNFTNWS